MGKWTRRAVIATGSVVGGGLALGVAGIAFAPNRLTVQPKGAGGAARLTSWLEVGVDNIVTVIVPHCDMGQGVHTALAMMAAEELDADWNLVRVEEAPSESEYANGYLVRVFVMPGAIPRLMQRGADYGMYRLTRLIDLQVTGGSSSVRGTGQYGMRVAGAAAKAMLIEAAAQRWNVAASECVARASTVSHAGSARSATFGELANDAAQLEPPVHPELKSRDQWSIAGRPTPRLDVPGKVNGRASYGIDVALPGMVYASVRAAPIFGTKLVSVDASVAEAMPGVKKVVQLPDAVAVVADGYWRALKAVRALQPVFGTEMKEATSDGLFADASSRIAAGKTKKVLARGDADGALKSSARAVTAEYRVPFLAHATMEPMNATARIADGRCEVWTGVQDPLAARKVAAAASGLDPENVVIRNQVLGGGFGRRLPGNHDYVDQAVRIAKVMAPTPVKLLWSREEDLQHDYYRPQVLAQFKGANDANGAALVWHSRFNGDSDDGAAQTPYDIPNQDIHSVPDATHVRLGAWRSVAHSQHGFFTESFIDELAQAAGKDPFEYRRALLSQAPRHRAVLERAAALSGWGTPLPAGSGRGVALVESFGSIVAEVAEVRIVEGAIKVERVFAAVDCGAVINPDTALSQIEGGVIFGLSAALMSAITIQDGRVAQNNFTDFRLPKLADAPRIKVEFVRSDGPLGGLGEPGVPPIAPAIANAVFAATGQRLRTLPLALS